MKCIEDEIPFELPDGWAWSRLGTLFSTVTGSTPSTKDTSLYGDEYPFYKPTDLDAGFEVQSSEDTVSKKGYVNGRVLPEYSVLVTKGEEIKSSCYQHYTCVTRTFFTIFFF